MIIEYHRPKKLAEALELIGRKKPATRPLGGGTLLAAPSADEFAVVDLQHLGLDNLKTSGKKMTLGASLRLQTLLESPDIPAALAAAIRHEAAYTLRQQATVAGSLVSADGRSPFTIAMLALDAQLTLEPGKEKMGYGDLLALRAEKLVGKLITEFILSGSPTLAYEYVARSPADRPILALALAHWPGGRTRLALGGFGDAPLLALDGKEPSGLSEAMNNLLDGATDKWATSEYRQESGAALLKRVLANMESQS